MLNKPQREHLRTVARDLYTQGKSYNQISLELNINKSTLSGWLSDIVRPVVKKPPPVKKPRQFVGIPARKPYSGFRIYMAGFRADGTERYHLVKQKKGKREDIFIDKPDYLNHVELGHIPDSYHEPKKKGRPPISREKECVICEKVFSPRNMRRETCSDECKSKLMSLLRKM
jgi:hypothetical protein